MLPVRRTVPESFAESAHILEQAELNRLSQVFLGVRSDQAFSRQFGRVLAGSRAAHAIGDDIKPYFRRQEIIIFVIRPNATGIRNAERFQHWLNDYTRSF